METYRIPEKESEMKYDKIQGTDGTNHNGKES